VDSLALPIVIDASALDWLPWEPAPQNAIRVITPHPGEAARLLRSTAQAVQADRLSALRNVSRRFGNTWVVLKGHQTLIGRNGGEIHVNSSGNPHLAQGGSGDALSGYLAGLLTQPALRKTCSKLSRTESGNMAQPLTSPGYAAKLGRRGLLEELGNQTA